MVKMVGLHGRMGSGKDTVLERLQLRNCNFQRVSFADPLKQSAAAALGVTVEELEDWKRNDEVFIYVQDMSVRGGTVDGVNVEPGRIEAAPITIRQYLQNYGTEAHRDVFGGDFWVEQAMRPLDGPTHDFIPVFTDVRFENEAEAIRSRGGCIVRIASLADRDEAAHASETPLPHELVHYTIDNFEHDDNFYSIDQQVNWLLEQWGMA